MIQAPSKTVLFRFNGNIADAFVRLANAKSIPCVTRLSVVKKKDSHVAVEVQRGPCIGKVMNPITGRPEYGIFQGTISLYVITDMLLDTAESGNEIKTRHEKWVSDCFEIMTLENIANWNDDDKGCLRYYKMDVVEPLGSQEGIMDEETLPRYVTKMDYAIQFTICEGAWTATP